MGIEMVLLIVAAVLVFFIFRRIVSRIIALVVLAVVAFAGFQIFSDNGAVREAVGSTVGRVADSVAEKVIGGPVPDLEQDNGGVVSTTIDPADYGFSEESASSIVGQHTLPTSQGPVTVNVSPDAAGSMGVSVDTGGVPVEDLVPEAMAALRAQGVDVPEPAVRAWLASQGIR